MREHPILGAVLFAIGAVLIVVAYASGNAGNAAGADALITGHVLAFNGALLAILGSGRRAPMRLSKRRFV